MYKILYLHLHTKPFTENTQSCWVLGDAIYPCLSKALEIASEYNCNAVKLGYYWCAAVAIPS